jgi:hypothetical protein
MATREREDVMSLIGHHMGLEVKESISLETGTRTRDAAS